MASRDDFYGYDRYKTESDAEGRGTAHDDGSPATKPVSAGREPLMAEPKRDEAPMPWHFVGQMVNGGRVHNAIRDADGMTVAVLPVYRANSAGEKAVQRNGQRIVRAVNGEAKLRSVLEKMANAGPGLHSSYASPGHPHTEWCFPCMARAALAASEEP